MRNVCIKAVAVLLAVAWLALPAHAICMGDGEYEQALEDVRARELSRGQSHDENAANATTETGSGGSQPTEVARSSNADSAKPN